jgi:hypothetical protein
VRCIAEAKAMRDIDIDRFLKLVGLFGSEHDGERANAAGLATKMLREAGLTWEEFFDRLTAPAPTSIAPQHHARRWSLDHEKAAEECLACGRRLTTWERGFLESMQNYHRLSERQAEVLARICSKCEVNWS